MAVTDYIFQEETVEKRNFGAWLVAKMVAAGWQQVGSNPPTALNDPSSKFYMMKTKRDADNAEAYIGINDYQLRVIHNGSYSNILSMYLYPDYTPGAAGAAGTSTTRGLGIMTIANQTGITAFGIAGAAGTAFPADTLFNVRFCITKNNVTLFVRAPSTFNVAGHMTFFGLPDFLQKEKVGSGSMIYGSGSSNSGNDGPIVCDTILGTPSVANMYESSARWIDPQKSPDGAGQFPLMPGFVGGGDTGIRHRIPSLFFLKPGGILDRDIIQVNGMNFEIMVAHASVADINSNVFAYRIS